jgi:hypothetical protein
MNRTWLGGVCLVVILGCQAPPEKVPVKPLPEDGPTLPYADLVARARLQATSATEAFYINSWAELEESARSLEQTARHLVKANDVPARNKNRIEALKTELVKEAATLREAAKAKDDQKTNATLQRINLAVRELRSED